jgi:predicted DNA-binding transcriptional regulator
MSARKHYCGIYKGLRIYQDGEVIGFNWYGIFYATKKRKKNYVRIKDSESRTFEELKRKIKDNKWGEQPQGT